MKASVLIVDDEANIRRMLASLLEHESHHVEQVATGEAALVALERSQFEVVLLDLLLPGADGLTVLARILEREPDLPVIMMSGRATLGDAVKAARMGAYHFLEKPISPDAMVLTVRAAIELQRVRERTRAASIQLAEAARLIGSSPAMQELRSLIATVAPTDARVLITGESGTGKELVAAALHTQSSRADQPFVAINSAAIPRELIESELFGHERGAFTGALALRRGKFELADGGTLFLDEVADLDADAQAKLLRVVDSGAYQRVGGQRTLHADVRVVAATNRDLQSEIAAGRFREDLFFRLSVIPITLPPLRERLNDLPELIGHFLTRLSSRERRPVLSPAALAALRAYHWPGNVRELANFCERLSIFHPGEEVDTADVLRLLPLNGGPPDAELPLPQRLDAYERDLIREALRISNGNISDAARRLMTDRPNLYRRMRRLGLS